MVITKKKSWEKYLRKCFRCIVSDNLKKEFETLRPNSLPSLACVYLISDTKGQPLYVGRTKNLNQRIYYNHLMGPLTNARLKKYLIHAGVCKDVLDAKHYIKKNCVVRWLPIKESRKRGAVEGYLTGRLFPKYGIEDEH